MKNNLRKNYLFKSQVLPLKGRLLAIDYGERRIGIAVTDELQITAQIQNTIQYRDIKGALQEIKQYVKDLEVQGIVLGLPLSLNGSEGPMSQKVREFADLLEKELQLPIVMWDERLTSQQAERTLREFDQKPSTNKGDVDKLAAYFILRNYLDSQGR